MKHILVYISYILFINEFLNAINSHKAHYKSNDKINNYNDAIKKTYLKSKFNFNQNNNLKINITENLKSTSEDFTVNNAIKEKNINGRITIETRKK